MRNSLSNFFRTDSAGGMEQHEEDAAPAEQLSAGDSFARCIPGRDPWPWSEEEGEVKKRAASDYDVSEKLQEYNENS